MSDIFTDKKLYPSEEVKIKDHFKDFYDSVFTAFIPFFIVKDQDNETGNFQQSEEISLEQMKKDNGPSETISKIETALLSSGREFHIYRTNKQFPADEQIYKNGTIVTWDSIVTGARLNHITALYKALRTSIGALRLAFQRQDLADKLNAYTTSHAIWHPGEGQYDVLSKIAIYKVFKLFNKYEITITDEFWRTSDMLLLNELNEIEFSEKIKFKDYYIYSADKEILFSIDWDSFFFLIATDCEKMEKIMSQNLFEGFLCDDETVHNWEYKKGEIEQMQEIERNQRTLADKPAPVHKKKKWWQFWI